MIYSPPFKNSLACGLCRAEGQVKFLVLNRSRSRSLVGIESRSSCWACSRRSPSTFGGNVNIVARQPDALKQQPHRTEVLTRLHARACQVANEVRTLLSSGFGCRNFSRGDRLPGAPKWMPASRRRWPSTNIERKYDGGERARARMNVLIDRALIAAIGRQVGAPLRFIGRKRCCKRCAPPSNRPSSPRDVRATVKSTPTSIKWLVGCPTAPPDAGPTSVDTGLVSFLSTHGR